MDWIERHGKVVVGWLLTAVIFSGVGGLLLDRRYKHTACIEALKTARIKSQWEEKPMREKIIRRVTLCLSGIPIHRCKRISPTVVDYRMPSKKGDASGTVIRVIKQPEGWIFKCGDMVERINMVAR